jgi:glutathione S-transferase
MKARLYVVHGSHPCATVERALQLKGIPYRTVELPASLHAPIQRVLFGRRTVPGLRLDGERISGSRAILARLEQLHPEPPLFPAHPAARERVEEAERWGEETFQPVGRRVLWFALRGNPEAALSYSEHSRLPIPEAVARLSLPLIARAEFVLNGVTEETVRADLEALPGYLDKIDGWIAEGVIGGEQPNAADLQIASTLRLLMTLEDLRPLIEPRPAGRLALRLFPEHDGRMPTGSLPAAWLPKPVAAAR